MTIFRRIFGGASGRGGPASVRHRPGGLVLDPEQRLARLYPRPRRPQRMAIEWARELVGPGEVVWDAGAADGVFAYCAAVLSGPSGLVLAIEERERAAAALRTGAEQLGAPDARFEVLRAAVGDEVGDGEPERGSAGRVTLDSLLRRHRAPTLVRVSERVASLALFAGARRILSDTRPVLLVGVPPRIAPELGPLLRAGGYELFDAEVNPSDRIKLVETVHTTLAVPRSPRSREAE